MENQEISKGSAREKILQTALHLFYSRGIKSTGVDTIIAESGVAKMTFYKHFPSKQNLVIEVLKRGEEIWFERLRGAIEPVVDPKKRLFSIFDFLERWFQDSGFRGCAFINTTTESGNNQAEECRFSAEHKRRMKSYIEEIAKTAGLKNTEILSEQFVLLIDGATIRAQMEGNSRPAKLAKDMASRIMDLH